MTSTHLFELFLFVGGVWFTYIGAMNLASKKYYVRKIEKLQNPDIASTYDLLPRWRVHYVRYALGAKWLAIGLTLLVLLIYRVVTIMLWQ